MPIERIKLSAIPNPTRKKRSVIYEAEEWKNLMRDLPRLKAGEALQIVLGKGTLKHFTNPVDAVKVFRRHVSLKLKELNLEDIEVFVRGEEAGVPVMYVVCR